MGKQGVTPSVDTERRGANCERRITTTRVYERKPEKANERARERESETVTDLKFQRP